MQLSNVGGRATLLREGRGLDVHRSSGGRFPSEPRGILDEWDAFTNWAEGAPIDDAEDVPMHLLRAPVPEPRQIFAIGLNYTAHAIEAGFGVPTDPPVFTKFVSSLAGPRDDVVLPSESVDWEVELVVVIGRQVHRVSEDAAWDHVAGVMVGQDLSDRVVQLRGESPQFSFGKSYPGFGPVGPALVTVDELPDPDDLELGCSVNGVTVQSSRTSDMIFSVPELVARLAAVCTLLPGDLIFTGTPGGTNGSGDDARYLRPGDRLESWIVGVGELCNVMQPPATTSIDGDRGFENTGRSAGRAGPTTKGA